MAKHSMEGRDYIYMLSDLASPAKYVEVKRTAEDRERWRAIAEH